MNKHGIKDIHGARFAGLCFTMMIFVYILISFVGQTLLEIFDGKKDTVFYIVNSLFSVLSMEIVLKIVNHNRHEILSIEHYFKKSSFSDMGMGVVFAAGMFMGFGFLNQLIASGIISIGGKVESNALPLDTPVNLVLFTIFYALIPAVEEEAFFRGLLRENMHLKNKWLTAVAVGLSFGIYHGSVVKFVYQFLYGFGLTILAMKAGNVLPCVVAHFLNNFVILLLEFLGVTVDLFNPFIICSGIVLVGLFYLFIVVSERHAVHQKKDHHDKYRLVDFWWPFGVFGSIVCITLAVLGVCYL